MKSAQASTQPGSPLVNGGCFTWKGFLLLSVFGLAAGAMGAWVAEAAKFYVAQNILFFIFVGVFVGLAVLGLVRFAQLGHRPSIVWGVVLAAAVAVAGQLRDEPTGVGAWLVWLVGALLTLAPAVAVIMPAIRIPFCNRCGSWYRTIRNGRIDEPTARLLAETCGVDEVERLRSPRYRLSCCQGGCGPTRCELSWEASCAAVNLVRLWLDDEKRDRIVAILDGLEREEEKDE